MFVELINPSISYAFDIEKADTILYFEFKKHYQQYGPENIREARILTIQVQLKTINIPGYL